MAKWVVPFKMGDLLMYTMARRRWPPVTHVPHPEPTPTPASPTKSVDPPEYGIA
ncbi:hypothetical protein RND71_015520 [Anisodus tanguticus]|uniref:Uncharacterized protein n=1 Tax=Anisodus tanguticus TaxID=243964 RepID=A0AAE1VCY3_9SOLA|nr:hypothetical protein RND71_015520 [Anisodus tanguticus]